MEISPEYKEPTWSLPPTKPYFFETIREGRSLSKSSPITFSKLIVGRLPSCDILLEHPSSSRFHAVIQFKKDEAFLYDLGSTHGTFLNKKRVEVKKYLPIRVGDMIKFGESSRLFIFSGPEDRTDIPTKPKPKAVEENLQVSWGFKEDAYEGDEWNGVDVKSDVDRSLIPTDASYVQDPKKVLLKFIESNGCDLQTSYQGEKKVVECHLSITGLDGPVLAKGSGKKKPAAEKDACLEMCFKLEKLGILEMQRGFKSC